MAIYNPSGLTLTNNIVGLKYTRVTDSSVDWSGVTGNTYFFDVATQLPYYKNVNNVIYDIFTGTTNDGLRVIPMATANTTLATASNDYYMNVRCPYNLVANKVLCLFSTAGADQVRVGIYRGQDLTATLVGQGAIAGGAVTTISEFTITAVSGQTLSFSGGEWMVIAMAIGGTTTSPQSSTTIANNSLSWNNTTDSASTGFPTNPRSKGGTNTSFPSFEIYP